MGASAGAIANHCKIDAKRDLALGPANSVP
jgi:hypothetical protein